MMRLGQQVLWIPGPRGAGRLKTPRVLACTDRQASVLQIWCRILQATSTTPRPRCAGTGKQPSCPGVAFRPPFSSFANTFRAVRGAVDMPSSITEEDSQAEAVFRHAASCQHDLWRAASVPDVWCSSGRSLSQLCMACSCYFSSIAPTQIWPRGDLALPDKVLRKIAFAGPLRLRKVLFPLLLLLAFAWTQRHDLP